MGGTGFPRDKRETFARSLLKRTRDIAQPKSLKFGVRRFGGSPANPPAPELFGLTSLPWRASSPPGPGGAAQRLRARAAMPSALPCYRGRLWWRNRARSFQFSLRSSCWNAYPRSDLHLPFRQLSSSLVWLSPWVRPACRDRRLPLPAAARAGAPSAFV